MASNILAAMRQIKSNVAEHLQAAAIERLCHELKHVWRERLLGPVVTVHAFLLQVLHGNTACDHMPHLERKGGWERKRGSVQLMAIEWLGR